MKFDLETISAVYYEHEITILKKLGFMFEKIEAKSLGGKDLYKKIKPRIEIEINSLEELLNLIKELNEEIIFDGKTITIYDDCLD